MARAAETRRSWTIRKPLSIGLVAVAALFGLVFVWGMTFKISGAVIAKGQVQVSSIAHRRSAPGRRRCRRNSGQEWRQGEKRRHRREARRHTVAFGSGRGRGRAVRNPCERSPADGGTGGPEDAFAATASCARLPKAIPNSGRCWSVSNASWTRITNRSTARYRFFDEQTRQIEDQESSARNPHWTPSASTLPCRRMNSPVPSKA